jgi:hypothetical protein
MLVMSASAPSLSTPIILSANASDLAWSISLVVMVLLSWAAPDMMAPGASGRVTQMDHLALIHPTAWKGSSRNFVLRGF